MKREVHLCDVMPRKVILSLKPFWNLNKILYDVIKVAHSLWEIIYLQLQI